MIDVPNCPGCGAPLVELTQLDQAPDAPKWGCYADSCARAFTDGELARPAEWDPLLRTFPSIQGDQP